MNKRDVKNIVIVILLFLIILMIGINNKYLFGNTSNYFKEIKAFSVLKDNYLQTKKLFPLFINKNGIYDTISNNIVYGYYNPFVIFTCFININLYNYYSIVSVISFGIGVILLYLFLYKNNYSKDSILLTVSFLILDGSIFKYMFNSVLDMMVFPFIILSFIAAKRRIDYNQGLLFSICMFLISIINYNYLFPVIIVLIIYGIYCYYNSNNIIVFKKMFWYILNYLVPIMNGLLLASFVLIPIFNKIDISIMNYYSFNYKLNIILLLSIIYGLFSNKKNRFLSIILILFIVFLNKKYLCNIVLISILVNLFFEDVIKKKIDYKIWILGIVLSIIYLFDNFFNLLVIIIVLLGLFLYKDTNKKEYFIGLLLLLLFSSGLYDVLKIDMYNKDLLVKKYNFDESNTLANMIIGKEKSNKEMIGFNKVIDKNGNSYYKSNDVLYRGFSTNNILSYDDYNELNGLAKQEALLSNIIADVSSKSDYVSYVKNIVLDKDSYSIEVKDINKYIYDLDKQYYNNIIHIEFDAMSDNCNNSRIIINNIARKISCKKEKYKYTISDKSIKKLYIYLDKGNYRINNIKMYSLDYAKVENSKMELNEYSFLEKGNSIVGNINSSGNGYFIAFIPYDNGYDVSVDGKIENYQKVDNEYIGIPLSKGIHSIVIKRNNRYFLITCFFSYLGLAFMFFIKYLENKRRFT